MKSDDAKGRGGDALVSQYLGSNVTSTAGTSSPVEAASGTGTPSALPTTARRSTSGAVRTTGHGWRRAGGRSSLTAGCRGSARGLSAGWGRMGDIRWKCRYLRRGAGSREGCNHYKRKSAPSAASVMVGESGVRRSLLGLAMLLCWSFVQPDQIKSDTTNSMPSGS